MLKKMLWLRVLPLVFMLFFSTSSHSTIVQFQTVLGSFEVNLYDETTVGTVTNFLEYVDAGDYSDTLMHRKVNGFIAQGGGFSFDDNDNMVADIDQNDAISNEPLYSNIRGTIAMAKLGGNPNSATNEWFFNLADNSENLDRQNGGFTVFGEVIGNGMDILDAIAALPDFNVPPFSDLPLRAYTQDDLTNQVQPGVDNLVLVNAIVVIDAAIDTASDLNPVPNTLINEVPDSGSDGDGGGGGSFEVMTLLLLFLFFLVCSYRRNLFLRLAAVRR